jgi:hypothetical protein
MIAVPWGCSDAPLAKAQGSTALGGIDDPSWLGGKARATAERLAIDEGKGYGLRWGKLEI